MNLSKDLENIFHKALGLEAEERNQYLSFACRNNIELKNDLEALFRCSESGGAYFEQLSKTVLDPGFIENSQENHASENIDLGNIGPWKLVEAIGQGGMGDVYLAERADFQYARQVAIKVLPSGHDDPVSRYRFRYEQQILSQLNHENIARFIDGGVTPEGVRYFVMDYINGETLLLHCNRRKLTSKCRIKLFQQVCRAVHYAHQHNVIHRDLKPSNILVNELNEVKLLDFGIAKVLQTENRNSELTNLIHRPLTLAYSSPEMINGETVDQTTDVYSLGVLLYELITGLKPFNIDSNVTEILNSRNFGALIAPSQTLEKGLLLDVPARDLDTIILKALNPEQEFRYQSAHQLTSDIDNLLSGRPIEARPYNFIYHFKKFVYRHRKASVATIAIISALSFLSIFSWHQMREAQAQRDRAEQQKLQTRATNDFLNHMLEEIGPDGEAMTLDELLLRGKIMLEKQASTQNNPAHMGRVSLELAQAFGSVGNHQETLYLLDNSKLIAEKNKDFDLLSMILCTYTEYKLNLDLDFAKNMYDQGQELLLKVKSPSLDSVLACNKAQAMILEKTGDSQSAINVLDTSLELLDSHEQNTNSLLFPLLSLKTHALYSLGKNHEFLETNSRLLKLYRDNGRSSTTSYMTTLQNRAILLDMSGQISAAADLRKYILDKFRKLDGSQRSPHNYISLYGDSLTRLGLYNEAISHYKTALNSAHKNGDAFDIARNQARIGIAYSKLGEFDKALGLLDQAEIQFNASKLTNKRRLNQIDRTRAEISRKSGKLLEATSTIQELLNTEDYLGGNKGFALCQTLREASEISLAQSNLEQAAIYIDDFFRFSLSLAIDESESAELGYAYALKGRLYIKLNQPALAIENLRKGIKRISLATNNMHPELTELHDLLDKHL